MRKRFKMIVIAEIYNQKPNDPIFTDGTYTAKTLEGIKLLAESLNKAKKDGRIKDVDHTADQNGIQRSE